jgi:hypothetical protein
MTVTTERREQKFLARSHAAERRNLPAKGMEDSDLQKLILQGKRFFVVHHSVISPHQKRMETLLSKNT